VARIRTIKPETPHSSSMGKVSREARLCFILMWTLADDAGRLRGNSRMLASLLFPYDNDAKDHIEGWLVDLVRERCIQRYEVNGDEYVEICNWLTHQKIDKPSRSKLPPPPEPSRILANPRERSSEDQGSKEGIKDQGSKDQGPAREPEKVSRGTFDGWSFIDQRLRPAYPRGTYRANAWITASRDVERLIEQGVEPDELVANAVAYQRQQEAEGNEGTKFILSPVNWLAEDNWRGPFPISASKAQVSQDANIAASQAWLNRTANA
jgi:hypothetical protein